MAMRILIVSPFFKPNVGGVETHLDDLCRYLAKRGNHVNVITYQPLTTRIRGRHVERNERVEIRRIPWFGIGLFYRLESWPILQFVYLCPGLLLYALLLMLKRGNFDVIHGHGIVAGFIAAALGRLFHRTSVVSLHTIYRLGIHRSLARFVTTIFSMVDSILVPSAYAKAELVSAGVNPSKVAVFRYWIDQRKFKPMDRIACRRILNLPEDTPIALFVGRLIESKGVRLVLNVAKKMREILFIFVGDGPLAAEVMKAILLSKNVRFIGKVENERLPCYYCASDFLVWGNPDVDYLGRVTIEALSCGLPAILPNEVTIFGVKKKVSNELKRCPSLIFTNPDENSLAKAITSLLNQSSKSDYLRKASRLYATRFYSEKNADVILRSYYRREFRYDIDKEN